MSKSKCPCGDVILADIEDWETPLCYECYTDLLYINRQAKDNYQKLLVQYNEANTMIDELEGALRAANNSLGYLAKHDFIEEKFNEVSQNGYFKSREVLTKLKAWR